MRAGVSRCVLPSDRVGTYTRLGVGPARPFEVRDPADDKDGKGVADGGREPLATVVVKGLAHGAGRVRQGRPGEVGGVERDLKWVGPQFGHNSGRQAGGGQSAPSQHVHQVEHSTRRVWRGAELSKTFFFKKSARRGRK